MLEIHSYFVADTSYIFDEPKRNLEERFNYGAYIKKTNIKI